MTDETMTLKMPDGTMSDPFTMADMERMAAGSKAGLKQTDADKAVYDKAYSILEIPIRDYVQRIERLEAKKREIAETQKDIYLEAKVRGYDTKAIREIVKIRKRDPQDYAEFEAVVEMYKSALGM